MARDVLGPEMKAAGFRRAGRVFWRDGPHVCHVASVQMNRWGSSDESDFDLLLGVFWHRVEAILENPSVGQMPPPEHHCTFRIDLRCAIPGSRKPSWRVTLHSDFDALGRKVWSHLRDYGFEWFAYRSKLKSTLEWKRYVTPEGRGRYSVQELVLPKSQVVFKVMLGKKTGAIADLKQFAKNGYPEDALKLARKLHLPTRGIVGRHGESAAQL